MAKLTTFTRLQAAELIVGNTTVSTITTAAAVTYTPAQVLGGLIIRDTNGAARADLMPTAATLYAALENPVKIVGLSFNFTIRNNSGAANSITLTTNTGATLNGTMTVAQSSQRDFTVVFASPTAYTVYSQGTVVF